MSVLHRVSEAHYLFVTPRFVSVCVCEGSGKVWSDHRYAVDCSCRGAKQLKSRMRVVFRASFGSTITPVDVGLQHAKNCAAQGLWRDAKELPKPRCYNISKPGNVLLPKEETTPFSTCEPLSCRALTCLYKSTSSLRALRRSHQFLRCKSSGMLVARVWWVARQLTHVRL